jgi:hypothetical protein
MLCLVSSSTSSSRLVLSCQLLRSMLFYLECLTCWAREQIELG